MKSMAEQEFEDMEDGNDHLPYENKYTKTSYLRNFKDSDCKDFMD
jgi:hypothetical protein